MSNRYSDKPDVGLQTYFSDLYELIDRGILAILMLQLTQHDSLSYEAAYRKTGELLNWLKEREGAK